jgi:mannose-6-phosphate isomerase-like protein (cupin superfamily)
MGTMHISRLHRDGLVHENGLHAQRLLPWPALNAPFQGSWCVVAPGTASTPHSHHEHEIFIALRGEAVVHADGEQRALREGDIAFFPPGSTHHVHNAGPGDFEMYSVWWDEDMSRRFTDSHHNEGTPCSPAAAR